MKSAVNTTTGIGYAIAAFLSWGILPLYWKALKHVGALQILAHRFIWSFILVALLLTCLGQWKSLKIVLTQPKKLAAVMIGSILVCANWGIYIWAVNTNHMVDASLGYYINPLLSVALGMLILRERLNICQWAALGIAIAGVLFLTFEYGKIPWIALALAMTFGFYGLVKKMAGIEAIVGLALETAFLIPLAVGYLLWMEHLGSGVFGHGTWPVNLLLMGAGVVTALPLLWFSRATQTVPLSIVGFTQYLTPTMTLILGLFLYHEPFTMIQLLGFGFIWVALVIFSWSQWQLMQDGYSKGMPKVISE
jgi:chloramphenicol-sensitive protein RarD